MHIIHKVSLHLIYLAIIAVLTILIVSSLLNSPASSPGTKSYKHPTEAARTKTMTTQPTSLTNTGPGSVVAIFIAVSLLSSLAHYEYKLRKLDHKLN